MEIGWTDVGRGEYLFVNYEKFILTTPDGLSDFGGYTNVEES
jgi:hypothetical protein